MHFVIFLVSDVRHLNTRVRFAAIAGNNQWNIGMPGSLRL